MPVPQFLLDRIEESPLNGPYLADAFAKLGLIAAVVGGNACMKLEYTNSGDMFAPDDLVPVIVLSLMRQPNATPPNLPDAEIIDAEFTVIKSPEE